MRVSPHPCSFSDSYVLVDQRHAVNERLDLDFFLLLPLVFKLNIHGNVPIISSAYYTWQQHRCVCVYYYSAALSTIPDASRWSSLSILSSSASLPLGLFQHASWLWTHRQWQAVCCWGETLNPFKFLAYTMHPLEEAERAYWPTLDGAFSVWSCSLDSFPTHDHPTEHAIFWF